MSFIKSALSSVAHAFSSDNSNGNGSSNYQSIQPTSSSMSSNSDVTSSTDQSSLIDKSGQIQSSDKESSVYQQLKEQMSSLTLSDKPITARALILGFGKQNKDVFGHIVLYQEVENGPTVITGEISGLKPTSNNSMMAIHINEFGDITDGLQSAGGHYNPHSIKVHGGIHDSPNDRHIGDLGNVLVDTQGKSSFSVVTKPGYVPLLGKHSVLSRSIAIHANYDDEGRLEVLHPTADSPCTKQANRKTCNGECSATNGCKGCRACNSYLNGNCGAEIALGTIALANQSYIEHHLKLDLKKLLHLSNELQSVSSSPSPSSSSDITKLEQLKEPLPSPSVSSAEKPHGDPVQSQQSS